MFPEEIKRPFALMASKLPVHTRWRSIALFAGIYLLLMVILGLYWSITPAQFNVRERSQDYTDWRGEIVTGAVTTGTLMAVMETLLEKPGGFTRNDLFPPGLWMDNMPNWEFGALVQARDLSRAMREAHSRSQSQSVEDRDLRMSEPLFNFNASSWMLPASENEYRDGLKYLGRYFDRLVDENKYNAQFYSRADNLTYWLGTVETRLGSLSQRLSASVGQQRLNTALAGDPAADQSTPTPLDEEIKTPWLEIDDVFHEARGTAWALIHFLKAAEIDFANVLAKKNATVSLQQIIRELEATQQMVFSPVILNGSGFGLVANHSLVMASYISRANAAIIDLRSLLSEG